MNHLTRLNDRVRDLKFQVSALQAEKPDWQSRQVLYALSNALQSLEELQLHQVVHCLSQILEIVSFRPLSAIALTSIPSSRFRTPEPVLEALRKRRKR
jgi:hypothetical protein